MLTPEPGALAATSSSCMPGSVGEAHRHPRGGVASCRVVHVCGHGAPIEEDLDGHVALAVRPEGDRHVLGLFGAHQARDLEVGEREPVHRGAAADGEDGDLGPRGVGALDRALEAVLGIASIRGDEDAPNAIGGERGEAGHQLRRGVRSIDGSGTRRRETKGHVRVPGRERRDIRDHPAPLFGRDAIGAIDHRRHGEPLGGPAEAEIGERQHREHHRDHPRDRGEAATPRAQRIAAPQRHQQKDRHQDQRVERQGKAEIDGYAHQVEAVHSSLPR